ncbi:hypothetical protein FVE85_7566 [Porphyridium purpureum]|uniref:F-box domain-containing protein n=1 Tax=Porphyridium purpureum TaxID=35688 RepID=A0A5J4Z7N1_PORPP|nr:hypothetical protein FVE85_7566 [Porphyridium purpureum]|eukprot:POR4145..scf295_1
MVGRMAAEQADRRPDSDVVGRLPPELFTLVMEHVRWSDLVPVMNVCTTWRQMFFAPSNEAYWITRLHARSHTPRVGMDDQPSAPAGVRYVRARAEMCHGCCKARAVSGLFAAVHVLHTTVLPLCVSCFNVEPNALITADKIAQWYGQDVLRSLERTRSTPVMLPLQRIDPNIVSSPGAKRARTGKNETQPRPRQPVPRNSYHLMEHDGRLVPYNEQALYPRTSMPLPAPPPPSKEPSPVSELTQ